MTVAVIPKRGALRQNSSAHYRGGREFWRGVRGFRAKIAAHFKKHRLQAVLFQNFQDLIGVTGMRTVLKGEHKRFWRQVIPKDFKTGSFLFACAAALRGGKLPFDFLQDLFARVLLLYGGNVVFPSLAVNHHSAGLQIAENFTDLFLVERLDLRERGLILAKSAGQIVIA